MAGDVVVIPPGVVHSGEPTGPEGYAYRALYVDPDHLPDLGSARSAATVVRAPALGVPIASTLRRLHAALASTITPVNPDVLVEAVGALDMLLGGGDLRVRGAARVVEDARSRIDACEGRLTSLGTLADEVGVSRWTLIREFRAELGITPHRYALAVRVAHASRLLRRRVPLVEVALETGFCDQAHFTRVFGEVVGTTPGRFRQVAWAGRPTD